MPNFSRTATIDWAGSVRDGKGDVKAGTGAFSLPVSFPRRIGDAEGSTSPEELIAAAHAACYAMALNATVGRKNGAIGKTHITCTITALFENGIKIMSSHLNVTAYGLKGLDASQFAEVAKEADGRCPVSNAYRGTMQITVDARVA